LGILPGVVSPVWVLAWLVAAPPPVAEPEAEKAVLTAKNAFEYRDFEAVEKALDPWLHPPKIASPKLMVDARRLMGVSRHVLGNVPSAKEEFAQLLLLDPRHQLDPVVIPPQVIATFEEVRAEMKDTLNRILAERGEKPLVDETGPTKIEVRVVPSPAIALIPFGGPQFALDQPGLGVLFAATQAGGMFVNSYFYFLAAKEDSKERGERSEAAYQRSLAIMFTGLGVWVASYVVSAVLALAEVGERSDKAALP
jgi:hypothetical protein